MTDFYHAIAEPLTVEEETEKDALAGSGFDWNKREYQGFIRGCEMHGRYVVLLPPHLCSLDSRYFGSRNDFEGIRIEVPTKTVEEIEAYAKVFWQRYTEIDGASPSPSLPWIQIDERGV